MYVKELNHWIILTKPSSNIFQVIKGPNVTNICFYKNITLPPPPPPHYHKVTLSVQQCGHMRGVWELALNRDTTIIELSPLVSVCDIDYNNSGNVFNKKSMDKFSNHIWTTPEVVWQMQLDT